MITTMLSFAVILDLGKHWLLPLIEGRCACVVYMISGVIRRSTGFDASLEVELALKGREIYSVSELSCIFAKIFRYFVSTVNLFAPYRQGHPVVVSTAQMQVHTTIPSTVIFMLF